MNYTASNDEKTTAIVNALESDIEELELIVAPALASNHNETATIDVLESEVEELDMKLAPGVDLNHNETLVRDREN